MHDLWSSMRILPLVTFTRTDIAADYGQALVDAGLTAIEVGVRTAQAFEAISQLRTHTSLTVIAGTLTTPDLVQRAIESGAHAGISPNWDPTVAETASNLSLPFAPGIATPSELGQALSQGIDLVKVFPVAQLGGTNYLRALSSVFPLASFVPSGGIAVSAIPDYLSSAGVHAVTGSFLPSVTDDEVDLDEVAERARALADLEGAFL
jgi:2-dehydro-3-deoxyphosphogluconate aldolase / (4S)-4-hydroxy-2-oxoglutarate aldolase